MGWDLFKIRLNIKMSQRQMDRLEAARKAQSFPPVVNTVPQTEPQTAPTSPAVPACRQQTTANHVVKQKSKADRKAERKALASTQRKNQESNLPVSAFKSTNTARKVKQVRWAMDQTNPSSSSSKSSQTKEIPMQPLPLRASSQTRRAVKDAAKALVEKQPVAMDEDDSATDSDDESAVDTGEIPMTPRYRRGLKSKVPVYKPTDSDSNSDFTSSSAIDDSLPPVRSHFTPKYVTHVRQDKLRKNPQKRSTSESRRQVKDWKLGTAGPADNTHLTRPRPQSLGFTPSTQWDLKSDSESAIDDRVPMYRPPAPPGPSSRQVPRNISPHRARSNSKTAKKEAQLTIELPRGVPSDSSEYRQKSKYLQTRSPSPEHRVSGAPSAYRQKSRYRQSRTPSPPHRVPGNPSEYRQKSKFRQTRSPSPPRRILGDSSEYRQKSKLLQTRSPSPPRRVSEPSAEYRRQSKHRKGRSPSPPPARLDPIFILRPKSKTNTSDNNGPIFVLRTKEQKERMLAGEKFEIKHEEKAASSRERPSTPFRLSDSSSKKAYTMSGGLGSPDWKGQKVSSKKKSSGYKPPTVESGSDNSLNSDMDSAFVRNV